MDTLPIQIKKQVEDFTRRLRDVYKDALVSIILYGSAASGEFAGRHSNINIAIVLTSTALDILSKAYTTVHASGFKDITPVFFTEEFMCTSADVFPIEFLDMKENYVILYGKDVLGNLAVDPRNLRFQCEQELKAKLVTMKKLYMLTKSASSLKQLLFKSLSSSLHILRNIIRLKGKTPPYRKEDILKELQGEFTIDPSVFSEAMAAKSSNRRLSPKEIDALFIRFVRELEKVAAIIDRL